MQSDFTNYAGVGDVASVVQWDVVVADRFKCIGAINPLFGGVAGIGTNTLAEASEFIRVGFVPDFFVGRVTSELPMLQHSTHLGVEDRCRYWGGNGAVVVLVVILCGKEGVVIARSL